MTTPPQSFPTAAIHQEATFAVVRLRATWVIQGSIREGCQANCQARIVSGRTMLAISTRTLRPSGLPICAKVRALAVGQLHSARDLRPEDTILSDEILVAPEELPID